MAEPIDSNDLSSLAITLGQIDKHSSDDLVAEKIQPIDSNALSSLAFTLGQINDKPTMDVSTADEIHVQSTSTAPDPLDISSLTRDQLIAKRKAIDKLLGLVSDDVEAEDGASGALGVEANSPGPSRDEPTNLSPVLRPTPDDDDERIGSFYGHGVELQGMLHGERLVDAPPNAALYDDVTFVDDVERVSTEDGRDASPSTHAKPTSCAPPLDGSHRGESVSLSSGDISATAADQVSDGPSSSSVVGRSTSRKKKMSTRGKRAPPLPPSRSDVVQPIKLGNTTAPPQRQARAAGAAPRGGGWMGASPLRGPAAAKKMVRSSRLGTLEEAEMRSAMKDLLSESVYETDGEGKRNRNRAFAIQEIIDTERDYVEDLARLVELYLVPLRTNRTIPLEDIRTIFSNIETLSMCNQALWSDLQRCNWTQSNSIRGDGALPPLSAYGTDSVYRVPKAVLSFGDVYIKMAPYFKLYGEYCTNFMKASSRVGELRKSNAKFVRHCDAAKAADARRLDVIDYLIKPVQRVTKYPLLFREALEHTSPLDPEYKKLEQVLRVMTEMADHVNQEQKHREMLASLAELSTTLDGMAKDFKLVTAQRHLLLKGDFLCAQNGRDASYTFSFFLLSDMLLVTKVLHRGRRRFVARFDLLVCAVEMAGATLVVQEAGESLVIFLEDAAQRTEWYRTMWACKQAVAEADLRLRTAAANATVKEAEMRLAGHLSTATRRDEDSAASTNAQSSLSCSSSSSTASEDDANIHIGAPTPVQRTHSIRRAAHTPWKSLRRKERREDPGQPSSARLKESPASDMLVPQDEQSVREQLEDVEELIASVKKTKAGLDKLVGFYASDARAAAASQAQADACAATLNELEEERSMLLTQLNAIHSMSTPKDAKAAHDVGPTAAHDVGPTTTHDVGSIGGDVSLVGREGVSKGSAPPLDGPHASSHVPRTLKDALNSTQIPLYSPELVEQRRRIIRAPSDDAASTMGTGTRATHAPNKHAASTPPLEAAKHNPSGVCEPLASPHPSPPRPREEHMVEQDAGGGGGGPHGVLDEPAPPSLAHRIASPRPPAPSHVPSAGAAMDGEGPHASAGPLMREGEPYRVEFDGPSRSAPHRSPSSSPRTSSSSSSSSSSSAGPSSRRTALSRRMRRATFSKRTPLSKSKKALGDAKDSEEPLKWEDDVDGVDARLVCPAGPSCTIQDPTHYVLYRHTHAAAPHGTQVAYAAVDKETQARSGRGKPLRKKADRCFAKRDFESAMRLYSEASEKGSFRALCCLGDMYFYGLGTLQSHAAALHYYSSAVPLAVAAKEQAAVHLCIGRCQIRDDHAAGLQSFRRALTVKDLGKNGYIHTCEQVMMEVSRVFPRYKSLLEGALPTSVEQVVSVLQSGGSVTEIPQIARIPPHLVSLDSSLVLGVGQRATVYRAAYRGGGAAIKVWDVRMTSAGECGSSTLLSASAERREDEQRRVRARLKVVRARIDREDVAHAGLLRLTRHYAAEPKAAALVREQARVTLQHINKLREEEQALATRLSSLQRAPAHPPAAPGGAAPPRDTPRDGDQQQVVVVGEDQAPARHPTHHSPSSPRVPSRALKPALTPRPAQSDGGARAHPNAPSASPESGGPGGVAPSMVEMYLKTNHKMSVYSVVNPWAALVNEFQQVCLGQQPSGAASPFGDAAHGGSGGSRGGGRGAIGTSRLARGRGGGDRLARGRGRRDHRAMTIGGGRRGRGMRNVRIGGRRARDGASTRGARDGGAHGVDTSHRSSVRKRRDSTWVAAAPNAREGTTSGGSTDRSGEIEEGFHKHMETLIRQALEIGAVLFLQELLGSKVQDFITQLYGVVDTPFGLGMVMEYAPHGTLAQWVEDQSGTFPLSLSTKIAVLEQIAAGMCVLHRAAERGRKIFAFGGKWIGGVAHSTLCLEHVMVTAIHPFRVKLSNFGLAKLVTISSKGRLPLLLDESPTSNSDRYAADVYDFGVLAWELLVGKRASEAMGELGSPETLHDLDNVLKYLLLCCWNKDPSRRISFAEIVRFLTHKASRSIEQRNG